MIFLHSNEHSGLHKRWTSSCLVEQLSTSQEGLSSMELLLLLILICNVRFSAANVQIFVLQATVSLLACII